MVGSIVLCMRRRYRKSRRRRYPHLAVKPKVATPRRLRSSGLLPQNEKADGFGFRPPRLRPGSISFTAFRRLVAAWADRRLSLRPDHRRLASALRSAKRPSLCGPATALAPETRPALRRKAVSRANRAEPACAALYSAAAAVARRQPMIKSRLRPST